MTLLHPDETSTPLLTPADIQPDRLAKHTPGADKGWDE